MSRIGKKPIALPDGVTAKVSDNVVEVKGKLGTLQQTIKGAIEVVVEGSNVTVNTTDELRESRALHGLYRSLINNMVIGVSQGYEKQLTMKGVGYRAEAKGQLLELTLGYSHPVFFLVPDEINVEAEMKKGQDPKVTLKSFDKQLLGQTAAKLRSLRPPEPYKGKGIRYVDEIIRRKAGKTAK